MNGAREEVRTCARERVASFSSPGKLFFLIDCKLSWIQFFFKAKIRIKLWLPERDLFFIHVNTRVINWVYRDFCFVTVLPEKKNVILS